MKKIIKILILGIGVLLLGASSNADFRRSLKVEGSVLSSPDEAKTAYYESFRKDYKGLRVTDRLGTHVTRIVKLGFEIDGFARRGDELWEIEFFRHEFEVGREVLAVAWVHSDSGEVYYLVKRGLDDLYMKHNERVEALRKAAEEIDAGTFE